MMVKDAAPPPKAHKHCRYCDNPTDANVVWLKDKHGQPARIVVPWCGCDLTEGLQRFWPNPCPVVEGVDYERESTGWPKMHNRDQLEAFYKSVLPEIRAAARECGYAIGVHGSMRRDLDLIAAPWVADHSDKDTLARAVQNAACGITMTEYLWGAGNKPCGRLGTVFVVAWCDFERETPSLGCIDLAVMPDTDDPEHNRREPA